jgi:hypothetical protein
LEDLGVDEKLILKSIKINRRWGFEINCAELWPFVSMVKNLEVL